MLAFLALLVASPGLGELKKPAISQSPMERDQLAIYQIFLGSYNNGSTARFNLSNLTSTFNPTDGECLKGIELDPNGSYHTMIHRFDSRIALPGNIHLVDPEQQEKAIQQNDPNRGIRQGKDVNSAVEAGFSAGLLTLSEVAFDKNHKYAAMSFSFVCGELCGHGSTIVFEKTNGQWQESKHQCSVWMSQREKEKATPISLKRGIT
jgi:hypothetical protein